MTEQTSRLQELRRQLSSGVGSRSDSGPELQAMQEELRLALRREKESQEQSRSQATRLDSLTRTLLVKEEIIRVSEGDREDFTHPEQIHPNIKPNVCVCVCCAGPAEADGGAFRSLAGGAVDPGGSGAAGEPGPAGRSSSQRPRSRP